MPHNPKPQTAVTCWTLVKILIFAGVALLIGLVVAYLWLFQQWYQGG